MIRADEAKQTGRADPAGPEVHARRTGRGRLALVALASVALGVALATGVSALGDRRATPPVTDAATTEEAPDLRVGTAEPGRPAASAEAAVTAFLDAERAGDFARSYLLLSAADRDEYRTTAGWVAAHADVMPPVVDYTVEAATADASRGSVDTLLALESGLDTVTGLVPARARVRWVVLAEDGGWAVALSASTVEPLYPPAQGAAAAVRAWAASHQACAPSGEHTLLLGQPALAAQLCGATGVVSVGDPAPFTEGFDTSSFLAAYGEPVLDWALVVPVSGPVDLRAVVGPIGDEWIVVGVLAAGSNEPGR